MKETLRFLVNLLAPHRKIIIASTILAALAAALETIAPIIMGRSFDLAGAHTPWFVYGAALLAWFLIRTMAEFVRAYLSYRGEALAQSVAQRYIAETSVSFMRRPLAFHYGKRNQEVIEKIQHLRWDISNTISGTLFDLLPALLTVVGILGYLATVDWRITAAIVIGGAVYYAYSGWASSRMIAARDVWNERMSHIGAIAWDALRNALVVKSSTNEAWIAQRVMEKERVAHEALMTTARVDRNVQMVQGLLLGATTFAVLSIGISKFAAGTLTFGGLSALTAYSFSILGLLRSAQWQFSWIIRLTATYNAARPFIAEPSEDYEGGREAVLSGGVEYRGIRFRYREERAALEDVSFSVKPGERVAIVGESGEGKTTLVDLLGRYYLPQSGEILFDGLPSKDINLLSLRSQMAYVPQDLSMLHDTIDANIRFGRPNASDEDVRRVARLAHLADFIEKLPDGWKTVVGERGLKLSGGERQRVALARAFLRDPKILILDEPTSNLDSKTEAIIQDSLSELMKGRTTFVIAHRLKTVMHADRILVLKDGRIVEQGTHDELAKKGAAYASLLKAQGTFVQDAA